MPPDPVRRYCRGFRSLWRALIINWMLFSKHDLRLSHRKQANAPSNMKLVTSLMDFKCQPYGIFDGFS